MEVQFINVFNSRERKTGQSRQIVRSYAMRSFRHRQRRLIDQRSPNAVQPLRNHNVKVGSQSDHPSDRMLVGSESSSSKKAECESDLLSILAMPVEIFSADRAGALDIPLSLRENYADTILHYYSTAVAGAFLPLGRDVPTNPLRTKVLPLAIGDAAVFHIILATSAMHLMVWGGGRYFDPEGGSLNRGLERGNLFCLRHKLEGIRMINDRLNDPKQGVSDEMIIAICHLAEFQVYKILASALEHSERYFGEFETHMDGIEQIVNIRGGLETIGLKTCSSQLVLRIDRLYSALTGSKSRFALLDAADDEFTDVRLSYCRVFRSTNGLLNAEVEGLLDQLQIASRFLDELDNTVSENDFFTFAMIRNHIDDNLFNLGTSNPISARSRNSDLCCQVAARIYVQTVLTKVNCKVYGKIVTELKLRIEQVGVGYLTEQAPDLLLWLLLVGGAAAPFSKVRIWFCQTLAALLKSTSSWEDVQQRLSAWPWRPKYCFNWRVIWREALMHINL